jgi:hypothetical protein
VNYPMMGPSTIAADCSYAESSGNTLTTDQMAAKPDYVVRMLEDADGDGVSSPAPFSQTSSHCRRAPCGIAAVCTLPRRRT